MYRIHDIVVYENGGICEVTDIGIPEFVDTKDEYYRLRAIGPRENTIYVKVKNEQVLRYTITQDEAEQFLVQIRNLDEIYNADNKTREKEFGDIIKERDWLCCLGMYKGLVKERSRRNLQGRQLNANDDRYFSKIEKLICDEFAVAMELTSEQVSELLAEACGV